MLTLAVLECWMIHERLLQNAIISLNAGEISNISPNRIASTIMLPLTIGVIYQYNNGLTMKLGAAIMFLYSRERVKLYLCMHRCCCCCSIYTTQVPYDVRWVANSISIETVEWWRCVTAYKLIVYFFFTFLSLQFEFVRSENVLLILLYEL